MEYVSVGGGFFRIFDLIFIFVVRDKFEKCFIVKYLEMFVKI